MPPLDQEIEKSWVGAIRDRFFNSQNSLHCGRVRINLTPQVMEEERFLKLGGTQAFDDYFKVVAENNKDEWNCELYFYQNIYAYYRFTGNSKNRTLDGFLQANCFPKYDTSVITKALNQLSKNYCHTPIYYKRLLGNDLRPIWNLRTEIELNDIEWESIQPPLLLLKKDKLCPKNWPCNLEEFKSFEYRVKDYFEREYTWPEELTRRIKGRMENFPTIYSQFLANLAMWMPAANSPVNQRGPRRNTINITNQSNAGLPNLELIRGLVRTSGIPETEYSGFGYWVPPGSEMEGELVIELNDQQQTYLSTYLDPDEPSALSQNNGSLYLTLQDLDQNRINRAELKYREMSEKISIIFSKKTTILLAPDPSGNLFPVEKIEDSNHILCQRENYEQISEILYQGGDANHGTDPGNMTFRIPENLDGLNWRLMKFDQPPSGFPNGIRLPGLGNVGGGPRQWSIRDGYSIEADEGGKLYLSICPPQIRVPDDRARFGDPESEDVVLVEVNAPNQTKLRDNYRLWQMRPKPDTVFPAKVNITVKVDGTNSLKTIRFVEDLGPQNIQNQGGLDGWGQWVVNPPENGPAQALKDSENFPANLVRRFLGEPWNHQNTPQYEWLHLLAILNAAAKNRSKITYQQLKNHLTNAAENHNYQCNINPTELTLNLQRTGVLDIELNTRGAWNYIHANPLSASLYPAQFLTGNGPDYAAILTGTYGQDQINDLVALALNNNSQVYVENRNNGIDSLFLPPRVVVKGSRTSLINLFRASNIPFTHRPASLRLLDGCVQTSQGTAFTTLLQSTVIPPQKAKKWNGNWVSDQCPTTGLLSCDGDTGIGEPRYKFFYAIQDQDDKSLFYQIPEPNWFYFRERGNGAAISYDQGTWLLKSTHRLPLLIERALSLCSGTAARYQNRLFEYAFVPPQVALFIKSRICP